MKKQRVGIVLFTVFITSALMVAGFFSYLKLSDSALVNRSELDEQNKLLEKYSKILSVEEFISSDFLFKYDKEKQEEAVYNAMFDALGDKYSRYLNKDELALLKRNLNNSFTGIGISFEITKEGILVKDVIKEGPAETAGIQKGDIILEIDGKKYNTANAVRKAITGKVGDPVVLKIKRGSDKKDIKVIRGKIEDSTVEPTSISDKIGYVKITSFGENTAKNFEEAINSFESNGKESVIIDLRSNPGGYFDEGTKVADRILPKCKITYTKDKHGNIKNFNSDEKHTKLKVILLIDENSASASEIVASALIDNGAAVSVGQKTFGKGIVQETRLFKDGTAVSLTVKEYFSPKGTKIHGVGITPQYVVANSDGKDLQLEKAIELAGN